MPCYLFTYHAYGSWMPDRARGYVKRGKGILPSDSVKAEQYRSGAKESVVEFTPDIQRKLIQIILDSQDKQEFQSHAIATESSHVHALLSWRTENEWLAMRSKVKSSLTRGLNRKHGRREWFSEGASRKRVQDREHFDYLVKQYLPSHRGWKWSPELEFYR